MGIPLAKVTKIDGTTNVVKPGSKGICAIIAPCQSGTANAASAHTKPANAVTEFGYGFLTEAAAYIMSVAGNPVVLIRATASTAGANSAVTHVGVGTSVVTATGVPLDDFKVLVTFVTGGTIGVAGITYTYSLDGGTNTSAVQALGAAVTITLPNSGLGLALAAGTILAGQTESFTATGPRLSSADISTALEALRISSQPWEMILIGGHDATAATIAVVDTWLAARETEGRFRGAFMNGRMKTAAEAESAFTIAMDTAYSATATIRVCVGAEGGACPSALPGRGINFARPTSLAVAARVAKVNYGVDPAYVQDGPVASFTLADTKGNPVYHDEAIYPGCDALRLMTLRTFDRKAGTFITNANVLSTQGSDYVWIQHVRTMNRACEIAFDVITQQFSKGFNRNPKLGPNGEVYVAEEDAQRIDDLVNQSLSELRGQVSDLRYRMSRTDNIGSNGPAKFNGELQVAALAYAKEFNTNASFARTISVQQ